LSRFIITEQVSISGYGNLSVLVKSGRVYTDYVDDRPKVLFTAQEVESLGIEQNLASGFNSNVSIGELANENVGLIHLDHLELSETIDDKLLGLRQVMPALSSHETQIVSRASQLSSWLSQHRYCGCCGSKTRLATEDRALVCTNCGNRIYPHLAPCVIGVVMKGDKILLGNGVRHKADLYTALAGFIEAGESAEHAFIRETKEEVGINIKDLEYVGSQSWPFPNQLMFGFLAHYESGDLQIDPKELNDAGWYSVTELPRMPGPYTIARHVINEAIRRISEAHV